MSDLESLDEVPGLLADRDVAGLSLAFVTGQPRVELSWPFTDGHWTIPGIGALVVYEPPGELVFHQSGRSVRAKRVT